MKQALLLATVAALAAAAPRVAANVGGGFGVNYHLPDDGDFKGFASGELAFMSQAFKVVRFDMKWQQIEKNCGHYDFSMFDGVVDALVGAGLTPYAILDYSNACYNGGSTDKKACTSDKCVAGYGKWAAAVAAHYANYTDLMTFTSTNEPDNSGLGNDSADADAKLTKAAGAVMKKAGFPFVGGVTEGVDVDYQKTLVDNGVLGYVTAMSTHPYTHHPPESHLDDLRQIRKNMDGAGGQDVKLLLDEWGYPYGGYPSSLDGAAQLLPRTWLLCLSFGLNCDLGIFFDWDGTQGGVGKPNALFDAAKAFQRGIGNASSFDKLLTTDGGGDVYAARFHGDPYPYVAIWSAGEPSSSADADADADWAAPARRRLGHHHHGGGGGKTVKVKIGAHACWTTTDYSGKAGGKLCADSDFSVSVQNVGPGPVYLTPVGDGK